MSIDKTEKIKVKSIRIYGSESSYAGDNTFDGWFDAGVHIRGIALFAPNGGAYDKTKFEVVFEDGETYPGRLDIQHYTMPYEGNENDLSRHIYRRCSFYAGLWCPPHMSNEDYQNQVSNFKPETTREFQEFLETYDIPKTDGVIPLDKLVYCLGCQKLHTKNSDRSLCGRCATENKEEEIRRADIETKRREKESDPLYPILKDGRSAVTKKMRQLLRQRSGKTWSVKGGRGTGWGWLTISAPPARMDNWRMTEEDQAELANLLGERNAHCQGVSVASKDWWHYLKACRGDFS